MNKPYIYDAMVKGGIQAAKEYLEMKLIKENPMTDSSEVPMGLLRIFTKSFEKQNKERLMPDSLELPIGLLKMFTKLFEKQNNEIKNLLRFREVGTLLEEGNFQKILFILEGNKAGISILDEIIRELEIIAEDL